VWIVANLDFRQGDAQMKMMRFNMQCPHGHTWVETFNTDHALFGRCPVCRTNDNTGKVINRIDDDESS
jgi:hypothetical protein